MRIYLLLITSIIFAANSSLAADAKSKPEDKQSVDKPIGQEIKELSNKEIFSRFKKNVMPVKINETGSASDNISILYDMPRKSLPSGGLKNASFGVKVKEQETEDTSSLISLGYKAAISGQTEAALSLYKKALGKEATNTNILFAIASLYHKLAQYKEAKIHYKKLLNIDPDYKKALNNYLVVMSEESPGQALVELKEIEKENPDFSPVQAQIGMIYAQMGDYVSAEKYLRRSVILAPEVVHYRYNLAVVFDTMQKYSEAISVYKQILDAGSSGEALPQSSSSIRTRMTYLQEKLAIHRD